jgi:D-tyrosyl-tRNA(Tyr) deacylase
VRAVLQRVSSASVTIGERVAGAIGPGLLVLIGIEAGDGPDDRDYIVNKIRDVRIFPDAADKMNLSVADAGGGVLVVSQFTLCGDVRKGRRPSFDQAAPPAEAKMLYEDTVRALRETGLRTETGEFQAMMQVALVNDGPVTILLDSRRRF